MSLQHSLEVVSAMSEHNRTICQVLLEHHVKSHWSSTNKNIPKCTLNLRGDRVLPSKTLKHATRHRPCTIHHEHQSVPQRRRFTREEGYHNQLNMCIICIFCFEVAHTGVVHNIRRKVILILGQHGKKKKKVQSYRQPIGTQKPCGKCALNDDTGCSNYGHPRWCMT